MSKIKLGESKLSSFISGSLILVLSNVCLKAINFFLLPLYTANLTPTMIGISDSITALTGIILPLLTMGLDSAFSAFYFDKNDYERSKKVFSTLTWAFLVSGSIPLLLMIVTPSISRLLFHTEDYSYIVKFALVSISFNLWYLPFSLEIRLQNKMLLYGISNVVASVSMVALNILFVSFMHLGESSLVLSTMIVHIESFLILLLFVRSKPKRKWFDKGLLLQMLKYAVPLVPMTLMVWILSLSDRYVILYYHGEAEVGLYGIGLRFTNLMNVVISAISMAYTTFAFSSKEDTDARQHYYYIFNIEAILLIGIAFTIGLFGKEIIKVMTTEEYGQSYLALRDLMFSQVFFAMTTIIGYGIFFEKKSVYSLIAVSAGAGLNFSLNMLLIPRFGISAAAFTTLLGYILYFFLTLCFSEKLYPCNYGQRKVLISLFILYGACCFCMELTIWIKMITWIICFVGMIVAYKDILKKLKGFAVAFLLREKKNNNS